jgi:DNA-binding NtrC family response regulator
LRDRREDIILLIANFVYQACTQFRKPLKKVSSAAKALFLDYPWPGNIRELRSVVESAVMVSDGDYITLSDLPMNLQNYATGHREEIGPKAIRNIEEGEKISSKRHCVRPTAIRRGPRKRWAYRRDTVQENRKFSSSS